MKIRFITEDVKEIKHRVIDIILTANQYDQLDLGRYEKISSIRLIPNDVREAVCATSDHPITPLMDN